jgi:hypothetical protein
LLSNKTGKLNIPRKKKQRRRHPAVPFCLATKPEKRIFLAEKTRPETSSCSFLLSNKTGKTDIPRRKKQGRRHPAVPFCLAIKQENRIFLAEKTRPETSHCSFLLSNKTGKPDVPRRKNKAGDIQLFLF